MRWHFIIKSISARTNHTLIECGQHSYSTCEIYSLLETCICIFIFIEPSAEETLPSRVRVCKLISLSTEMATFREMVHSNVCVI